MPQVPAIASEVDSAGQPPPRALQGQVSSCHDDMRTAAGQDGEAGGVRLHDDGESPTHPICGEDISRRTELAVGAGTFREVYAADDSPRHPQ